MKYAAYPGRFSPFHNGHKYIIDKALDAGKNVLIMVRDTPPSEADPYTLDERIRMIRAVYRTKRVDIMVIPDIESINYGRGVGWAPNEYEVPPDIGGISATDIRKAIADGDASWEDKVPTAVAASLHRRGETGLVLWLTGLSGAGKSTIATALRLRLAHHLEIQCAVLDGDVIRRGLCAGLGFSKEDRDENIRRIAAAAKLVADAAGVAIVAAISPYRQTRAEAAAGIGADRFVGVHVSTSLGVCRQRDPKGLYAKVAAGEIKGFTGVDDPYEYPQPEDGYVVLDTAKVELDECVTTLYNIVEAHCIL